MSVNGVGKKVNIKPLQQADSKDFKGGLRIDKFGEGVSEKDKAIFKAMDKNNDGVVTQDELTKFFAGNENSKGLDKNSNGIVTRREAKKFIKNNQTLSELQIDKKELLAFLSKAGQASENVKSCTINDQGQVVVTYNDGSTDTISPDASRINESTNSAGDKVTTTFAPNGKKSSEVVVGPYANQLDDCTTTTLYEADGETVKNITVTDSQNRVISKTEGNTVTDIRYGEQGTVYESVSVDGKLTKTTVKDSANNKTTVIEYDTAVGEDGAQLPKTRTETTGDEVKTYTFENGVKSTLTIKKGTKTENYEYNEAGTEAKHVSTDVVKGNGIIEHQAFSEQNGKNVTTISIDGKNQSQSVFGANGKVARTIKYADAPNGERATVVVIQDQESIADICNKFGMTQEEFEAFNKGNKNGLNGNVGAEVNVKGELEVTDSRFDGRLSSKAAVKAKNNRIYREQLAEAKSIANQRQETVMLISRDKNYGGSWENVARDLYKQEGNTQYSKMDLKVRAQQLQKLNPEVKKFEYGRTVIRVAIDPASMESNDTVRKLSNGSDATMEWVMAKGGETHAWNIALRACQQTENDVARPLTPLQQGIRAKKTIELNPGVFDKTGKMINPPANGKLKIPAGYTQAYKKRQAEQKAKLENQYYVAAEQVYKSAVDKTGMSAVSTIKKQLNSVNSDHIVQFYESYNTYLQVSRSSEAGAWAKEHGVGYTTKGTFGNKWMRSDDSSIYDTICSETGMGTVAGKQQRKDLCNDIFGRIATAAQKAGVSQADINNARNRFTSSMNAEFNGSGTVNTTKMEQATDWLIGKIHEAKTGAGAIDTKTAQDAFKSQYAQSVNGAQESFDKNMENVTWVGTFTAWAGNIFADNTTVGQMENKLGLAKGSLDKLNKCKTQAEFNTTYEQIFGVPFNAKNVATVMKLEENLQTIAQNEAQVEGINKSFATISRSNSLSDYENWVTAGIKNPQEKAQTLEAIYSQFGGADDISKLSEAAKMNAIRKAKDAEIAAIQAETKQLKGGKTTEQIREDISTLASASFGPNNNIAKEVEKFNGNINRAEMVGTVVTEIGVTLIPVGRVLSLAGKGVRLANGAYKAYKTGKTVKTATTAVKATKAATTTAKTTQVAADVSNATGGITNRVKNVVSAASKDPITRQSAQAGFNSGVLDYSKYGDAEHAVEHGLETAAMFEIGGRASKFSQKLSSDLEISSAAGKWAVEAGVTGTADTAAAFAQTTIINGQDLSTEDGMMNFGLDAAFAALGARGTRVKPQGAKSDGFNYGNTFKHQDSAGADPIIAHNSNVHVKTQKGIDNINAKTDELVRTSTDGAQLGGAHNELDALSNRAVRRSNQAKLDKKARTLSPEEQAKYDQSVKQHHKEETEHTFERHNELSEADFRTIGNSIKDAKTPNDLISLRRDLKQKEYSHGGVTAEYKALEDQIDNKLTNMIRNAGADDLDKISRQLADMKSQVQNDARLTGSLEKLGKEIDTRKAFLKDQKGSVEGILKNEKGFADANELDKVVDYIKTLDSEKALQDIDILRRGKKMTGQQKKVLDNAIESKKAELAQTQKESHTREVAAPAPAQPAKLTKQNIEQFEKLEYQEAYNQLRDRGIKVKTQRPDGTNGGTLVFEDGGQQYTLRFDKDGKSVGKAAGIDGKTADVDVFYAAQKKTAAEVPAPKAKTEPLKTEVPTPVNSAEPNPVKKSAKETLESVEPVAAKAESKIETAVYDALTNETDISKTIKTLYPDVTEAELQEIIRSVEILKNEKNLKLKDIVAGDTDVNLDTQFFNKIHEKTNKLEISYNDYKQRISNGKQITNMSDSELTDYYKKLVPFINDDELDCLIQQAHRIQEGKPRYLGTTQEKDILESIHCKQWFGLRLKGVKPNRGFKTSAEFPKAEIEFKDRTLTTFEENQLRHWIDDGKNWALDDVYDNLSIPLSNDTYLYRGVSTRGGSYKMETDFLNTIKEGAIIDNSNKYISTAKGVEYASSYRNESFKAGQSYLLKIKVPKDTQVLDMRLSDPNFDEIALQPHKLKVTKIDYNSGVVECEYMPL